MERSTIFHGKTRELSMVMFHSYVSHHQGVYPNNYIPLYPIKPSLHHHIPLTKAKPMMGPGDPALELQSGAWRLQRLQRAVERPRGGFLKLGKLRR